MYNFIDLNEVSEAVLPSEALMINGEYIENLIDGYRTLSVSGREALSPELDTFKTGVRDGSSLKNRRYPARVIVVEYQLIADSCESFREKYNKLGGILNVENAELIFNDEQDKYYTGTPSEIGDVPPGRNAVTGEIEFLCVDPFKYSVIEYEAEANLDESSVLIDYNGAYKSYPILEADFYDESEVSADGETANALTGKGDCGYVAFFTEDEKIIQLGDPNEVDGESAYAKAQTLVNQSFTTDTAWETTAKSLWAMNAGHVIPSNEVQGGSVAAAVASYAVPSNPASTSGTLLKNAKAAQSAPIFYYTVTAKTSGRTANAVKVVFTITTSLAYDGSYFGYGYGLKGSVYIGGAWRDVTIKDSSAYWRGRTAHTVNLTVNVTGLSATTAELTGIKFKVVRTDSYGQYAGRLEETKCSDLPVSTYTASVPEAYYLAPSDYGSATGAWHGMSIKRTIGADASGEVGASNFILTYKQKMCVGKGSNDVSQVGAFQCQISGAGGNNIAGVRILKGRAGKTATLIFYVNGAKMYETDVDISYSNKQFGASESSVNTSTITKTGNTLTFNIGGISKQFTDDAIKDVKARYITYLFEQYSDVTPLSYNGLYWVKFVKNNCNTIKDIPNKFSANDVVEADCKNAEIYLNGISNPNLGALGNDWEQFYLTPGLNQIGFSYSEWVADEYAPSIKIRYREVFL